MSIHQHPAFPGNGWLDEIGNKEGKGYTINVPLPPRSGDDLFIQSLLSFLPIIEQFKPDITAISAGFDGHYADPLLELNYTTSSFYEIGRILSNNLTNIFAVLEGGYNIDYLPKCIYNFIAGVNQSKIPFKETATISNDSVKQEGLKRIKALKEILSDYWL